MPERDAQPTFDVGGTLDSHHKLYDTLPLSGDQFRLLKLQHGQWDDSIVCYLAVHELTSQPKFEAVSHTWGSNQSSKVITMNGATVTVGANLECALRYIRSPDKPRVLWIDALCINQKDDIEKGHQVQKMCQVFSSASTVLAWLGSPHSNGERALSEIRQIGEKLLPIYRREANENGILLDDGNGMNDLKNLSPVDIKGLGLNMEAMDWDAIWDLCDRSFWRRIWIIQELALSGDNIRDISNNRCLVGCGSEWTSLPVLSAFVLIFGLMRSDASFMDESMARPFDRLKRDGSPAIEVMIRFIWYFDSTYDQDKGHRALDNLMRVSRSFQVTDPRDKLYGLLGIITDHPVVVNYKLDVSQVYKSLVTSWTQSKGNLHCILGNRVPSDDLGPSWLPQHSNWLVDGLAFEKLMRAAYSKGDYKPSPKISFIQDNNVLKARGIHLGKIDHVVGPFWSNSKSRLEMDLVGKLNTDLESSTLLQALGSLYLSLPRDVQDDVWRTCVLDSDTTNPGNIIRPAPSHFRQQWHASILHEEIEEDFEPHLDYVERVMIYAQPLLRSCGYALCCDRCFFVTEDLHMGLGPCSVRAGDEAVLLFGSPLCFILRSDEQGYRLVGDAYVQGVDPFNPPIMKDGKNLPVQDFLIY